MEHLKNNFTKIHLTIFISIIGIFTILTFLASNAGIDNGGNHNIRVFQTTIGVITGPMTGAIARGFQGCCTRASLLIMKFCAPFLIFCVIVQFIKLPEKNGLILLG